MRGPNAALRGMVGVAGVIMCAEAVQAGFGDLGLLLRDLLAGVVPPLVSLSGLVGGAVGLVLIAGAARGWAWTPYLLVVRALGQVPVLVAQAFFVVAPQPAVYRVPGLQLPSGRFEYALPGLLAHFAVVALGLLALSFLLQWPGLRMSGGGERWTGAPRLAALLALIGATLVNTVSGVLHTGAPTRLELVLLGLTWLYVLSQVAGVWLRLGWAYPVVTVLVLTAAASELALTARAAAGPTGYLAQLLAYSVVWLALGMLLATGWWRSDRPRLRPASGLSG